MVKQLSKLSSNHLVDLDLIHLLNNQELLELCDYCIGLILQEDKSGEGRKRGQKKQQEVVEKVKKSTKGAFVEIKQKEEREEGEELDEEDIEELLEDKIELLIRALSYLFVECSKNDLNQSEIEYALSDLVKENEEMKQTMVSMYLKHKKDIRSLFMNAAQTQQQQESQFLTQKDSNVEKYGSKSSDSKMLTAGMLLPQYKNFSWRMDVEVHSKSVHHFKKPEITYLLQFQTNKPIYQQNSNIQVDSISESIDSSSLEDKSKPQDTLSKAGTSDKFVLCAKYNDLVNMCETLEDALKQVNTFHNRRIRSLIN